MKPTAYFVTADLSRKSITEIPTMTQHDSAIFLLFQLTNRGQVSTELLDEFHTFSLTTIRPDGEGAVVAGERDFDNNGLLFKVPAHAMQKVGLVRVSVQMIGDEGRLSTSRFFFNVNPDLAGNYVATPSELTLIESVLINGPAILQEAQEKTAVMQELINIGVSDGASAYELAVSNGFQGTEQQWLASLEGPQGEPGNDGNDANLLIEQRTTDPVNPVAGRVWFRTDLV